MKDILVGQLLAIVDAIDNEVETIKGARKEIRSKLTMLDKAIKMNEELGVEVDVLQEAKQGHTQQLEDTKNIIRNYKLVRYRMMSAINILEGKEDIADEEAPPTENPSL